jgi:hypothetical protein
MGLSDDALDQAFAPTEWLGAPLAVAAWLTVLSGPVAMALAAARAGAAREAAVVGRQRRL